MKQYPSYLGLYEQFKKLLKKHLYRPMYKPQLLICTLEIITYVFTYLVNHTRTQYSLTKLTYHSFSIEINIQQTNIQLKPSPLYHHQHLCFKGDMQRFFAKLMTSSF